MICTSVAESIHLPNTYKSKFAKPFTAIWQLCILLYLPVYTYICTSVSVYSAELEPSAIFDQFQAKSI